MSYRIKVEGLEKAQRRFEKSGRTRLPRALVDGMVETVQRLKAELREEVSERFPFGSGNLFKKITARRVIRKKKGEIEGRIGWSKKGFYWRFLEHGTVSGVPAHQFVLSVQQDNEDVVTAILLAAVARADL